MKNLDNTYLLIILGSKANEIIEDSNDSINETPTTSTHQATSPSTQETNDSTCEATRNSTNGTDEITKETSDELKYCKKFGNYSLYSNSVVISRLAALRGINPNHIFVFSFGDSSGFDMTKVSTQKVFFQLTIDEIYVQTDETPSPMQVRYYQNFQELYMSITHIFSSIRQPKNFLVIMDDHGLYETFGAINFFELYTLFLQLDPKSLNIFADCCHSGYFLYLCQVFFSMQNHFKQMEESEKKVGSLFESFDMIFKIYKLFANYYLKENFKCSFEGLLTFFREQKSLLTSTQFQLKEVLIHLFSQIQQQFSRQICQYDFSFFSHKIIELDLPSDSGDILNIISKYFPRIRDLHDIGHFFRQFDIYKKDFATILNEYEFPLSFLIKIQEELQMENTLLIRLMKRFLKPFKISDLSLQIPSNHFICTTSHPHDLVPIFVTRRITDQDEIIMGSPGMSAFIHEIFLFPHKDGISIDRLKALAQITGTQIMQYAVSFSPKRKIWLSLDFRSIGSCNSLPFAEFNSQDDTHLPLSAETVLKSIGFSLLVRFQSDHETPQDPNFPIKMDAEPLQAFRQRLKKYCAQRFFFRISHKRNRQERFQLTDFPDQDESTKNEFYTLEKDLADDYYFSDGNGSNQDNPEQHSPTNDHGKKTNKSNSDNSTSFSSFTCNQEIPQTVLNSFPYTFKRRYDYFLDLRDAFFAVFQKILADDSSINRSNLQLTNILIEDEVYTWIRCFISGTIFLPYALYFLRPITYYIVHSRGSLISTKLQECFFVSFNIADQLVTPHYLNRKTFIKDRLKTTIHLPPISSDLSEENEINQTFL